MGTTIPRAILLGRGLHLTTGSSEEWEAERRCIGAPPDYFDIDASREEHLHARNTYCEPCPVQQQCIEQRRASKEGGSGVYAGMIWSPHPNAKPATIEDYHSSHKVGGQFRGRDRDPKYPKGWSEDRQCVGCGTTFTVTYRNHAKIYHDEKCRRWYTQMLKRSA